MATIKNKTLAELKKVTICGLSQDISKDGIELAVDAIQDSVTIEETDPTMTPIKSESKRTIWTFSEPTAPNVKLNSSNMALEFLEKVFNLAAKTMTVAGQKVNAVGFKSKMDTVFVQLKIEFRSDDSFFYFPKLQVIRSLAAGTLSNTVIGNNITMMAYEDENEVNYYLCEPSVPVEFSNVMSADVLDDSADIKYTLGLGDGTVITEQGIAYAQHPNAMISDSKAIVVGTSAGDKTANLTGLTADTKYYARPYVKMNMDTLYGAEITFTTLTA